MQYLYQHIGFIFLQRIWPLVNKLIEYCAPSLINSGALIGVVAVLNLINARECDKIEFHSGRYILHLIITIGLLGIFWREK